MQCSFSSTSFKIFIGWNMKLHLLIYNIHSLHAYTHGTKYNSTYTNLYICILKKNQHHVAHQKKDYLYCRLSFIFKLTILRWNIFILKAFSKLSFFRTTLFLTDFQKLPSSNHYQRYEHLWRKKPMYHLFLSHTFSKFISNNITRDHIFYLLDRINNVCTGSENF